MERRRRAACAGFVLPTVLFALLLLAGVMTGAFVAAVQSVRSGRLAESETAVRYAATALINESLSGWNVTDFDSLSTGSSIARAGTIGALSWSFAVRRTGRNIFALAAGARDTTTQAERSLIAFARLQPLVLAPVALARVRETPTALVAGAMDGADASPPGWNCPPSSATIATLTVQSSVSDSAFFEFGGRWSWISLVNWISALPTGGDSLPWRFESGDVILDDERFVGVLVALGNITIRDSSQAIGAVISRGSITFEGRGGAIFGAVVARSIELAPGAPASPVRLVYSSCAVQLAGRSRAPVRPLPGVPPADQY